MLELECQSKFRTSYAANELCSIGDPDVEAIGSGYMYVTYGHQKILSIHKSKHLVKPDIKGKLSKGNTCCLPVWLAGGERNWI